MTTCIYFMRGGGGARDKAIYTYRARARDKAKGLGIRLTG